jgi:hypothetical protein
LEFAKCVPYSAFKTMRNKSDWLFGNKDSFWGGFSLTACE